MNEKSPKEFCMVKNTIIEKCAEVRLSAYEFNIIFAIIRKTFGYLDPKTGERKTSDHIAHSQLNQATNIPVPHISRTLKKLIQRNIVTQTGNKIGINKNTDSWTELPKQVSQVTQTGNKKLPKQVTHSIYKEKKENITKETLTNVRGAKPQIDKRNPDIQEGIELLKATGNLIKEPLQRFALKRLYTKHGKEMTLAVFIFAQEYKSRAYCPKIYNFLDLEEKWGKLEDFATQSTRPREGVKSVDAEEILRRASREGRGYSNEGGVRAIEAILPSGDQSGVVQEQDALNSAYHKN